VSTCWLLLRLCVQCTRTSTSRAFKLSVREEMIAFVVTKVASEIYHDLTPVNDAEEKIFKAVPCFNRLTSVAERCISLSFVF
ncbi:hypothetical protein R3P38DRAFT_2863315, partial [Favolaschia claudopus]